MTVRLSVCDLISITELSKVREIVFNKSYRDTFQLMLYREIVAVCSEIHTKHINTAVRAERRIVEC